MAMALLILYPQTLEVKKEWNVHFEKYIRDLDKIKPVIWTGDLNVAPAEIGAHARDADHRAFCYNASSSLVLISMCS